MSEREEQELIERIAHELRQGVRFDASFDERVMTRVRREGFLGTPLSVRPIQRAARSLVRTRSVRVNPLIGLAAAAGFTALVIGGTMAWRDARPSAAATPAALAATDTLTVRVVQFELRAPGARSVALVGDFNEWNREATPLHAVAANGVWTISLPLPTGRHVYAFVVDGEEWIADPVAPRAPGDDFGVPNSVVTVGGTAL